MATLARPKTKPRKKPPLTPVVTDLLTRRFTLDEYHAMIDLGIFKPKDPYELLNGVIKFRMPQNSPHSSASTKLEKRFWRMAGDDWLVRTEKPITISGSESEPEPDLAVSFGPETRYDDRHPGPSDIVLLIEVADSSLEEDRGEKLRVYAAARIAPYWIVNVRESQIEVYERPRAGRNPTYRKRTDYRPGDTLPVILRGTHVGDVVVSELFL